MVLKLNGLVNAVSEDKTDLPEKDHIKLKKNRRHKAKAKPKRKKTTPAEPIITESSIKFPNGDVYTGAITDQTMNGTGEYK
jgi:hypothetical protein